MCDPADRSAAFERLRRLPRISTDLQWIGLTPRPAPLAAGWRGPVGALGASAAALVLVWSAGTVAGIGPVGAMGSLLAFTLTVVVVRRVLEGRRPGFAPFGLSMVEDPPTPPPSNVRRVRGRARARASRMSPLAGRPCVAFRLVGTSMGGHVDDAGYVDFDVVPDDGTSAVRVAGEAASFDLMVAEPSHVAAPSQALVDFLADRGLFPLAGPLHLSEALLVDGERVEVVGVVAEEGASEGYRETTFHDAFVATDGVPPVIRRVDTPGRS
jgi:hypothetical protein